MKLTYWDLDVVHTRMKMWDIKYQEIYNELFDHIVTAIEQKREAGDNGDISLLLHQIIDEQFDGYLGIEKVVAAYEKGYKSKVKKMIWANYRYYINLKSFLFTAALLGISCVLPNNKLTVTALVIAIFIAAIYASVYAYIKLKSIKPEKGKTSLIYSHTITQANLPLLFVNALLWVPQYPSFFSDHYHFRLIDVHPVIMAFILALILIYDLSCMRLCRQELKGFINIEPL